MLTPVRRRLFPALLTPFALGLLLAVPGCRKFDPTQPIELVDQACCAEANEKMTQFKGCVLGKRNCSKKRKWWMRGQVTCGPVDKATCGEGRCCNYREQYDPEVGEPDPDWAPPGFPKPEPEAKPDPEPEPEPEPAPEPEPEPAAPTIAIVLGGDGKPSIEGEALEPDALKTRLCEVAKALPGVQVSVTAASDVPYSAIVPTLDTIKGCGITSVKLEQTTD